MNISLTPECFVEAEDLIREEFGDIDLEFRYFYAEEGSRCCPLCFSPGRSGSTVSCETKDNEVVLSFDGLESQHKTGMNLVMEVYAYGHTHRQLYTEAELESVVELQPYLSSSMDVLRILHKYEPQGGSWHELKGP